MEFNMASHLEGKDIDGWQVGKKRVKDENDDSGAFSSCYEVEGVDGKKAFLKAFNLHYAFRIRGQGMDALRQMTEDFTYERDLLELCKNENMNRIVTALASGEYTQEDWFAPVPYLIFEIADSSLKTNPNLIEDGKVLWKAEIVHGLLLGIRQLHQKKIVHQDVKPSNILIFGENYSKLADLGNATQKGQPSSWDFDDHGGDIRYSPIELMYGYYSSEWNTRRFGADYFMVSNLICLVFTGVSLLSLILGKLPTGLRPRAFSGEYPNVLAHIRNAFETSLLEIKTRLPDYVSDDVVTLIRELGDPIPENRGNPERLRNKHPQFDLQRYVSIAARILFALRYRK